ncbi:hypothetical protein EV361DRAFT_976048 [Lentinula raphanica]|nr:hypothetical protein EV361DRAFT_976048 [Lentinula raphanica]
MSQRDLIDLQQLLCEAVFLSHDAANARFNEFQSSFASSFVIPSKCDNALVDSGCQKLDAMVWNEFGDFSIDKEIPLKVIYHGRIPFITHTVRQDFGFIGFSWQLTAQDILFVRYLVQRIGGRKIKWSRAHIEDERELQIRRAQSKARAALCYADNYPLRAHKFGHGAKRARRSNVGNGYKPVLVQRQVTRSMTKALEDIKAELSEDEEDELDMTSLEDQTSSLCLYSDDPRDTTSNMSTSKRKAESSVTHDSSPQRKHVWMFSPSDSDIAEELAVFKLLSVEEPQPSSSASGSAGQRSKKDLVQRNSTLSVHTSQADKENQDIANQRNLQSDNEGKRKRTTKARESGQLRLTVTESEVRKAGKL